MDIPFKVSRAGLSCVHHCKDCFHIHSSKGSLYTIIWLLHQYWKGHGLKSCIGLTFFFVRLYFHHLTANIAFTFVPESYHKLNILLLLFINCFYPLEEFLEYVLQLEESKKKNLIIGIINLKLPVASITFGVEESPFEIFFLQ